MPVKDVVVAEAAAIPDGERKIVQVDGLSIGVFHHNGGWYALRNSCMHRGGPVGTGALEGDTLVCPWHGFQYNITTGECLADPSARLDMYPVNVQDGQIHLQIPDLDADLGKSAEEATAAPAASGALKPNEFRVGRHPCRPDSHRSGGRRRGGGLQHRRRLLCHRQRLHAYAADR